MLNETEFEILEEAIRSENFSAARLEAHAESLAKAQKVTDNPKRGHKIAPRIAQNRKTLEKAYLVLTKAVEDKRAITPAAEWLIDNFHIVRSQLRDIHDHLPPEYYRELPKLAEGFLQGYPRVYGIAWAFVAHTDSRFDPDLLKSFLHAYQKIQVLTIGELWAIPITIRVILVENLRRLSVLIANSQIARKEADDLANEILGLEEKASRPIQDIIRSLDKKTPNISFYVQLLQRLRFQDSYIDPILEWLEKQLNNQNLTSDEVVTVEHNSQTAANATVRNIITSARLIAAFNWQDFFEEVSFVEKILREHPTYPHMDFATRDRYRQALEEMAKRSPLSETEIARLLLSKAAAFPKESREGDLGYYLISTGRRKFEDEVKFRPFLSLLFLRFYNSYAMPVYMFCILLLSAAFLFFPLRQTWLQDGNLFLLLSLGFLGLFPASEAAIAVINRLTIAYLGPHHLARLSLKEGLSAEMRTFVVVPTFFTHESKIESQLEQLEIHYLANPEDHLYFALLTDFPDSLSEHTPNDKKILEFAALKLNQLNAKYPATSEGLERFYIFHRRRLYNPQEERWMGWERKRGKLHEFNQLLCQEKTTSFLSLDGAELFVPKGIRYVITLDADTRLPLGAAKQLIGTMAHPLNHPQIDEKTGRVMKGYGILQPRITPSLPSTLESSLFQKLSTGDAGIDPYASAVSDIYQDLFGEGSFTGKGIYDLKIFSRVLHGKVPENSLLSHDLFEGNLARCGFLSDVELFEEFPSHTEVASARAHRWTRGDWQLLPWILGRGGRAISALGRWKMVDNLRRSLVLPFSFLLIAVSMLMNFMTSGRWLVLALLGLGISGIVTLLSDLLADRRNTNLLYHLESVGQDFVMGLGRFALFLILLPHQCWMSLDAVLRTFYRLLISHKKMLEWTTAAQSQAQATLSFRFFFKRFRGGLLLTGLLFLAVFWLHPGIFVFCIPLFFLWFMAPLIALEVSSPPKAKLIRPLDPEGIELLQLTGRRIWRFFSTFVTAEEHYLPPDNFQETPEPVIAHRSSPTNFGLYLLSTLAAHDFGWIGLTEMGERLEKTLKSLEELPKYEGHFYNWYETTEARALDPKYISSVDNGNLAGHLLTVGQACLEMLGKPVPLRHFPEGLSHTLRLLEKTLEESKDVVSLTKTAVRLVQEMKELLQDLAHSGIAEDFSSWDKLALLLESLQQALPEKTFGASEISAWTRCLQGDIRSARADVDLFYSWKRFAQSEFPDRPTSEIWAQIQKRLKATPVLGKLAIHCELLKLDLLELRNQIPGEDEDFRKTIADLLEALDKAILNSEKFSEKFLNLHRLCHHLFNGMDFKLLYDPVRKLFSIGFRVAEKILDPSYYDLLASEARLTSFIAIAKGDVPASHWFQLGRELMRVKTGSALLSWSGSMFEYLMPSLVMHSPENSILDQTCRLVVHRQIQYGQEKNIPWGISESAYNKRDISFTYQYSNFGVPDLGLKRGLGADLVVAPYATILAAMYESFAAVENLQRLQSIDAEGPYGFYEAVDFTASRLPEGKKEAVVKTYMAHHQGMSLVAIANIFKNGIMRDRFFAEPLAQAAELLLQERMPRNVHSSKPGKNIFQIDWTKEETEHVSRQYHSVNRPVPTTQVLSNGDYSVMVTSSGSGYSRFRDMAVTRWREDITKDNWGTYFFLKDCDSGKIWSAGYQPTCAIPDSYDVTFFEDRVRILRQDEEIASELEIFISPEDPAEIRRVSLTNHSEVAREIEITSYAEVTLTSQLADAAHPAFSNLFVQTRYLPELKALVANRRPRSSHDPQIWGAHMVSVDRYMSGTTEYESDRSQFLGRGRGIENPQAIYDQENLSGHVGAVLDPVFSLRTRVKIPPGVCCHVKFFTMTAASEENLMEMVEKFQDPATYDRVTDLAWIQSQVKLHYLNIEPDEAHLFQRLATRLLFSDSSLRPSSDLLKHNVKDVTGLWRHGISGDRPIILIRIDNFEDRGIIRQLLKAHDYFGNKGLIVDLVILNDQANSYAQELQNSLEALAHTGTMNPHSNEALRGKIFILRADLLSKEDRLLLYASARVVLSSRQGSLSEQVKRQRVREESYMVPASRSTSRLERNSSALPIPELQFFNGYGGFSLDGKEYTVVLKDKNCTPAPWINVIANANFGFQVSESGSGYTWSSNSRENQITPWQNDPVSDPSGESFYILDRDSGSLWSPTALPIRIENATYLAHHSQGFTRFEHLSHGIYSELTQFVSWESPVKISKLVLENRSRSTRRLSVTSYIEWVLGFSRSVMAPTTVTEMDEMTGAIFAFNTRSNEYGKRVSFAAFADPCEKWTADRSEFLGRNGNMQRPRGLYRREGLSGRTGAGLDPCAALQQDVLIDPQEKVEIRFFLGQAETREQAREMIQKMRAKDLQEELSEVKNQWEEILTQVQVKTPDESMNLMLNRWLLYQTLVCRFWARAAFYQAGGAFGFRDQLQDTMALVLSRPKIAREHILRAASRQFIEGDVQHWWHPPLGRGVRTHFSDDLLWLPFAVSHYLDVTQDFSILDAQVPFLEGPLLEKDQEDSYYTPNSTHNSASLYEHCVRALDARLSTGAHGLPLMGAGDWNDGMNRVGRGGQGESVWMAWFLYTNLLQFAEIAKQQGDSGKATLWTEHAKKLQLAAEDQAWDGKWYRRAYYDDGTPLGSATQSECQIDSLSQTWAVISKAANETRAEQAMAAVESFLIRPEERLIVLFTPPFENTPMDPGYIKGYLPGVRENGGQYTHAAVWCVIAYAMMKQGKKALELFKMLNPIHHTLTGEETRRYKIEPYVLAADIYSQAPYTGRGGWSWYTGSSGWMYRAGVESILGFQVHGDEISLNPQISWEWKGFEIRYRFRKTLYKISFFNAEKNIDPRSREVLLDGVAIADTGRIKLKDDGVEHQLQISLR